MKTNTKQKLPLAGKMIKGKARKCKALYICVSCFRAI